MSKLNKRLGLGLVALVVLLAGCGSDGSSDTDAADTHTSVDVWVPGDTGGGDPDAGTPDVGDPDVASVPDVIVDVAAADTATASDVPADVGVDVPPTPPKPVVYLGTLGGFEAVAFGLNDAGQVVGWSIVGEEIIRHAYLWTDGTMVDLGVLPGDEESTARDVNDAGVVVGTSESGIQEGSGTYHPFLWSAGELTELPGLGGQGWAVRINEGGTVCGFSWDEFGAERAVTWTDGEVTDIAGGSGRERQRALGLNDAGHTVGMEYTPMFGPGEAFRFDGTSWTVIGGLDHPYQSAEAHDINASGLAVGFSSFPSGAWHAALWEPGATQPIDLGTLPELPYAELYAVNDDGVAVGRSYDPEGQSLAILWDGEQLLDLNTLMPEDFEGFLWEARDINASGQIAATALVDGHWEALLLNVLVESADTPRR